MLWGGYHTGKEVPAECLIQMAMIFKHMNIEDWGCTLFALSAFFSVKLIRLCGLNIEMRASMYSISAEKKNRCDIQLLRGSVRSGMCVSLAIWALDE